MSFSSIDSEASFISLSAIVSITVLVKAEREWSCLAVSAAPPPGKPVSPRKRRLSFSPDAVYTVLSEPDVSIDESFSSPFPKSSTILSVAERRKQDVTGLCAEYGDEDSGWGFRVQTVEKAHGEDIPMILTLNVLPLLNRSKDSLDSFTIYVTSGVGENKVTMSQAGLRHFPPMRLRVEYVSSNSFQAKFILTCSWLLKDHVSNS